MNTFKCPQGQKKKKKKKTVGGWGGGGKSYSRRAGLPPAFSLRTGGALFGEFTYRARPFFSQQDPSSNTPSEPADVSPDWLPPAASQPFANEGTAAGRGEADGPPHLNEFDLAAQASVSSVRRWCSGSRRRFVTRGVFSKQLG